MNRLLTPRHLLAHLLVAPLLATLAACGGGTDGTGATNPQPSNFTSNGVMTKGSVIVNGVNFNDSLAAVRDDRNRTRAQLATGMVVKVRGRSDDGVTGSAEIVKVENEVRGTITQILAAASPQAFVVNGITVRVDTTTVYANVANFAALAAGARVEVHGLRDEFGNVRASRVEAVGGAGAANGLDEARGVVTGLNTPTKTFTLANTQLSVNYTGATFAPAGASEASLAGSNVVVEVRGSVGANGVFNATAVDIESLEDNEVRGRTGEKQDIEGYVTGFVQTPGTFQVAGRTVTTTASTVFVDGTAADLANNVQVEAEGVLDANGVLVASKIHFEHTRVLVNGLATAVNVQAKTVTVLGQVVQANDLTRIDARAGGGGGNSTSLADIVANTDCVEVRGSLVGGVLVADEIKEPSGCGKDLVQAPVTAKNTATFTLTFFPNLTAALGNTLQLTDRSGAPLSRDAFFAAVTPAGANTAGTLVKAKGTFSNGVLTAEEAELEN